MAERASIGDTEVNIRTGRFNANEITFTPPVWDDATVVTGTMLSNEVTVIPSDASALSD